MKQKLLGILVNKFIILILLNLQRMYKIIIQYSAFRYLVYLPVIADS